jgi:hypothetical protein
MLSDRRGRESKAASLKGEGSLAIEGPETAATGSLRREGE